MTFVALDRFNRPTPVPRLQEWENVRCPLTCLLTPFVEIRGKGDLLFSLVSSLCSSKYVQTAGHLPCEGARKRPNGSHCLSEFITLLSLNLKWRDNTVLITQGCNLHNYLCASRLDFACTPPFRHVVRCKGRCLQGHEIPFVIYTAASRLFNYWLLKKVGRKSFIYQWLPTKSDIFAFWCVDHWKITCYSVYEHYIRQLFLQYCMCIIIHICAFSSEITHQISHFRVLVGNQWAELHLFVNNCPINPENQPTRVQTRIRLIFTRWVYGEIEPLKQKQNGAVSTFVLRQPHDKNVNCCLNVLSSAPLP